MESIVNQPVADRQNGGTGNVISPEAIDQRIANEIQILTQANNKFWSSPDHNRKEYLHCFFQYPAMMVPVVQRKLIEIIIRNNPSIHNVIDPYMGSGTSLVTCMENGLNVFGQDINPLAILVARTRTGPYYIKAIQSRKNEIFKLIDEDRSRRIEANFSGLNKWFNDSIIVELSKIVRAIRNEPRAAIRRFYWVILAEVVRLTSNDRTSTFKLHIRTDADIENRKHISAIETFKQHFKSCIDDLIWHCDLLEKAKKLSKGSYIGDVTLKLLDSKSAIFTPHGKKNFYDLLVTSPPYGDNKTTVTYGQHSYLPLQWIDLTDIHPLATDDFLLTTSAIDSRGLGGSARKLEHEKIENLFHNSPSFKEIHDKLTLIAPDKVQKVTNFIYDLSISIINVHNSLKKNAYQIWTIGNRNVGGMEIPNDQIIKELIINRGSLLITTIERSILNKRMPKTNGESDLMSYEDILIFRKN